MSLTSKSRKESTESNAAQRSHNTMGVHPEQAQMYDREYSNDLNSRRADSSDLNDGLVELSDTDASSQNLQTYKSGDPSTFSAQNTDDMPTDEDDPNMAYRHTDDSQNMTSERIDHDWDRSTDEGGMAPSHRNDPDRTYGNS